MNTKTQFSQELKQEKPSTLRMRWVQYLKGLDRLERECLRYRLIIGMFGVVLALWVLYLNHTEQYEEMVTAWVMMLFLFFLERVTVHLVYEREKIEQSEELVVVEKQERVQTPPTKVKEVEFKPVTINWVDLQNTTTLSRKEIQEEMLKVAKFTNKD